MRREIDTKRKKKKEKHTCREKERKSCLQPSLAGQDWTCLVSKSPNFRFNQTEKGLLRESVTPSAYCGLWQTLNITSYSHAHKPRETSFSTSGPAIKE